jgi:LmbE family N-acetylglucosaminyl deacetylase
MKKTQNILIISAHADDHVTCAGTCFKLQEEQNAQVYEIVLTDSSLGQDFKEKSELSTEVVSKTRSKELSKAAQKLGLKNLYTFHEDDMGLTYSREIALHVASVIREVRPSILFIHNDYDAHPDHLAAHRISVHAVKMAAMGIQKETLGAPWRTPLVLCCEGMLPIKSQILVNITPYMKKKRELFEIYASQATPQAISFETSLAQVRGYHLRLKDQLYAEAFTLQEEFPILLFEDL